MIFIKQDFRSRATRPAQTNFADCKVALPIVLKDDREGSPLRVISNGVSGMSLPCAIIFVELPPWKLFKLT